MMYELKKTILSTGLVALFTTAGFGQVILPLGTFGDDYIGGVPSNSGYIGDDVIGVDNVFNLTGAELKYNVTADSLEIKILGNYFDNILSNSDLLGTTMGDLFISTDGLSWSPGDNTLGDYYGSGTETSWEYAVQLGKYTQPGLVSGQVETGSMVDLSTGGIQLSNASGIYRTKQEHRATGSWDYTFADPTWSIENGSLTVTINDFTDIFGTNIEKVGFHWTMSCANDVIEFEGNFPGNITNLPEPSAIGIFALMGVGGLLLVRRRLARRK